MLDQKKIGEYISEKRKGLGMTQKQLAEQIGLTDKAVSKWERGKSIPDNSVIIDLCTVLEISVNEFLSGEDILEEHYSCKAEENMMDLMKEKASEKKNTTLIIISLAVALVLFLIGLYAVFWGIYGFGGIASFLDLPSFLFLLGIVCLVLVAAGAMPDFLKAFAIVLGRMDAEEKQCQRSERAVKLVLLLNLLAGGGVFTGQMILALAATDQIAEIPARIAVSLVVLWYSLLLDLLLLPLLFRVRKVNIGKA